MKDHTTTFVVGGVAMFGILAAVVLGLEAVESDETTAILAVMGTGMAALFIQQLLGNIEARKATKGIDDLRGSLNGDLDARIEAGAARAVRTVMQQRDRELDERIRSIAQEVVGGEIDRLVLACDLERRDGV